jgi:4'-phosphopantetheinyl transferase
MGGDPIVRLRFRHVTPEAVTRGEEVLDEVDQARRDRFTHVDARDHLVVSRGLLADSLYELDAEFGRMARDPGGKPRLPGGPSFNLSHSHGIAVVAIQESGEPLELGVDVEAPWRSTDYDAIARRFFAAPERDALDALEEDERRTRFFELWTLKEAVLKATGKGLRLPLSSVAFELVDCWQLVTDLGEPWVSAQWCLESGHIVAVAAPAESVEWCAPTELPP